MLNGEMKLREKANIISQLESQLKTQGKKFQQIVKEQERELDLKKRQIE